MEKYHKIQTLFKRDPDTNHRTLLEGEWSTPEFEYLKDNLWEFTEKVDGTNIRVMWDGDTVVLGGKTDNAQLPSPLVARLTMLFVTNRDRFKEVFGVGDDAGEVCLYGEGYGAKIAKGGGNYGPDQDFVLFDVKIGDWWLRREDVYDIAGSFGIKHAPVVTYGNLFDMITRVRAGFKSWWGDFQAEGIVARPTTELVDRSGHRVITKLKTKDFRKEGAER